MRDAGGREGVRHLLGVPLLVAPGGRAVRQVGDARPELLRDRSADAGQGVGDEVERGRRPVRAGRPVVLQEGQPGVHRGRLVPPVQLGLPVGVLGRVWGAAVEPELVQ